MSFPTIQPAPVSITVGRGGYVRMDPRLYRVTWDNQFVEDLTPYIGHISVTHDVSRLTGNWILDAEVSYEGWKRLHPFLDWLAPVSIVTYADGSQKFNQLGHYLVLDSPEHREEVSGSVRIDARDALWALNAQGWAQLFTAPTGSLAAVGNAVMNLVNSAQVPGARPPAFDHFRNTLAPYFFDVGLDWLLYDAGERVLEIANGMLTGTNRVPLTTTNVGSLFTEQQAFINTRQPLRTWYANPPLTGPFAVGGITPLPNPPLADRLYSPIAEYVDTVPMTAGLVDEVTIIGNIGSSVIGRAKRGTDFTYNPGGPGPGPGGGGSGGVLPHPSPPPIPPAVPVENAVNVFNGSRKTITYPQIPDNQNAANYKAASILEQLLTENTSATLVVEADPTFVAYYNTIDLAIWDLNGDNVINGRYVVNQVKYGMMPEDSTMRLEISKLPPYTPTFHASS
jgi:hypothetical protein